MLKAISHGAALAIDATADPSPSATKSIGSAQQVSVAEVVSRSIQPQDLGFSECITDAQRDFITTRYADSINVFVCQKFELI